MSVLSKRDVTLDRAWRVVTVLAASLASALGASPWVATPLAVVAGYAALSGAVRRRRRGWPDALVVATATGLVALVLLGVVLQLFPIGLTRLTWAIGVGVVELVAVVTAPSSDASGRKPLDRLASVRPRAAGWYGAAALVTAAALIISVHSAEVTQRAPLQLSAVSGSGSPTVLISAGTDGGRYELLRHASGGADVPIATFTLADGRTARYPVLMTVRTAVLLRSVATGRVMRSLVLDPVGKVQR